MPGAFAFLGLVGGSGYIAHFETRVARSMVLPGGGLWVVFLEGARTPP